MAAVMATNESGPWKSFANARQLLCCGLNLRIVVADYVVLFVEFGLVTVLVA